MAPRVLITTDLGSETRRGVDFDAWRLKTAVPAAVERGGGVPLAVGPGTTEATWRRWVDVADAVVITGGAFDLPPTLSRADPTGRIDPPKPERTALEWALLDLCKAQRKPVLGLCGGMQLMAVWAGGTLCGDLESERGLHHEQPHSPTEPGHGVRLHGWMREGMGTDRWEVNSTHHQAVDRMPSGWRVLATADDGTVEAIGDGFWVGVQWHPELQADGLCGLIFRRLAERALQALEHP